MSEVLFDGELFADYHQIYLCDAAEPGLSEDYGDETMVRRVQAAPGSIIVHTARNMTVPLRVALHPSRPALDLDAFQHVVETTLACPSGELIVAGLMDYAPDAARVKVGAAALGVLVTFQDLDKLSEDGLEGDDRYAVHLWPEPVQGGATPDVRVLKAWPAT
jgi:hypothetical protein